MLKLNFDKILFFSVISYTLFGFAMFFSASLGIMTRNEDKFYNILSNQFTFGFFLGLTALLLGIFINYKIWKNLSFFIFGFSFLLCLLVFIPGLGVEINGSRSWLNLLGFTFQPSEILKYSSILFLSAFYAKNKDKLDLNLYRLLPVTLLSISTFAVILQPDIGTAVIIISGIMFTFFILAAKIKDIAIGISITMIVLIGAYITLPHIAMRVNTFLNPSNDTLGQSYQINQAAISLGSGELFGDGYAASSQKYHYLPEPVGDSIFAVIGEEFGFMGCIFVLFMILLICFRLLYLAMMRTDIFEKGVLTGVAGIFLTQSFLNIGSISGAIPLTGVPLPLVSHGSTSLIITLGMLGICMQLAKQNKKSILKNKFT